MVEVVENNGRNNSTKGFDPDDPEYKRSLLVPADIKMDINLVKTKKRVALALQSHRFRDELEGIMSSQIEPNDISLYNNSLISLNHLADFFQPKPGRKPQLFGGLAIKNSQVIPINDLKVYTKYSRLERLLRCKFASVFRLINLFGWNSNSKPLLSICTSRQNRQFLVNPTGLLYHEITSSSLMKIDARRHVIDPGSTVLDMNNDLFDFHAMIYNTRPDIRVIFHVETPASITVSYMDQDLLPLSNNVMILGPISVYDPFKESEADESSRGNDLSKYISINSKVLVVKSRGFFVFGESIEETWHYAMNMQNACETQVLLASLGEENLVLPEKQYVQETYDSWRDGDLGGVSLAASRHPGHSSKPMSPASTMGKSGFNTMDSTFNPATGSRPWKLGELEFEAMMRYLDNFGYRTGHLYRHKVQINRSNTKSTNGLLSPMRSGTMASAKCDTMPKGRSRQGYLSSGSDTEDDEGVEIPPYTSSVGATMAYFFSDNEIDPLSYLSGEDSDPEKLTSQRISSLNRYSSERKWFNTPNSYSKRIIDSDGAELEGEISDDSLSDDAKILSTFSDTCTTKESKKRKRKCRTTWISDREAAFQARLKSASEKGDYLPPPQPVWPLTAAAIPQGRTGGKSAFLYTSPPFESTLVRGGGVPPGVTANYFAPQGDNPREFRDQQKNLKKKYYDDLNTSGPQSRVLENISWDEARRLRDETLSRALGPRFAAEVSLGGQSALAANGIVTAASRAIINKNTRDKAIIYDGLFSHQNPFGKISNEEIEMYRHEISLKQQQGGQGKSATIDFASAEEIQKSIRDRENIQEKVIDNKPYSDGEEVNIIDIPKSEKSLEKTQSPDNFEISPSQASEGKKKKKMRLPFFKKKN